MTNASREWIPLADLSELDPKIVLCPVGGELRCFADGTIVVIEGARQYEFRLPVTVRLFVNFEQAGADQSG